jgi:predicted Zn-dependent protease with MMP-like domain
LVNEALQFFDHRRCLTQGGNRPTDAPMSDSPTPPRRFGLPPSLDDIAEMAERALREIPERLAQHVGGIGVAVEDMPGDDTLDELGIESAWDLTGLYVGTPLPQRSTGDIARQPDLVFLYREPILLEWVETGEDLYRLVRNVVIHEIGHHFGFSDAEIAALEEEME